MWRTLLPFYLDVYIHASFPSHFTPNDNGVGCIRDENLKIRRLYGDRGISNFS